MKASEAQIVALIPRLRRYARVLLRGDTIAADDLVQDCLERALDRLGRWRPGTDLRAWLFTIMHNLYVNQVRRAGAAPRFVALPEQYDEPAGAARAERCTELDELQRAINSLSDQQREILVLVSLEGLRYREVAAVLGVPEGTVMSRLSRARQQLRTLLEEDEPHRLRRVK
ncbi:MAG: sigma-70 family RNA polymerase sigma factor [Gammaproteobacteria bacterium]|nr:sigma-70 family RNA polymerase sigma factor [Gammaproteobacteria bacterium]MCB1924903.1 sigma-70 family RNA polymerase sigma factor [Gammaproteobacteria bacterium]